MDREPQADVPVAELVGASRRYEGSGAAVTALAATDLRVETEDMLALRGPSGSGKTTLLHLLGLLLRPSTGQVRLLSRSTADAGEPERDRLRRRHVGFVYQDALLVPHLTAIDNVLLYRPGLTRDGALGVLDRFGVSHLMCRRPAQLSGGEQQRVALARALVHAPTLLLADEPTANLDSETASVVVSTLRDQAAAGRAVVVATHDPRMIEACSRNVQLEQGEVREESRL